MEGAMMIAGVIGLLHVVVALAGAVIAGMHLGRNRWAPLLVGGFVAEAVITLAARLGPAVFMRFTGDQRMSLLGTFFALTTLLGVAAQGAIVAGVAGLLKDAAAPNPSSAP